MSLKAAKQLLRREMKQKINMISKEEKQIQSANVSSKLFGGFQSFSVQNSVWLDCFTGCRFEAIPISKVCGPIFEVSEQLTSL